MNSRWRAALGSSGHLAADWVNFLGLFSYYTLGIDVHYHMYYNKTHRYHYTLLGNGKVYQHFSASLGEPRDRKLGRVADRKGDTCIVCGSRRDWPFR